MEPVNGESMGFLEWVSENSEFVLGLAAIIAAPFGAIMVGRMQVKMQKKALEAEFSKKLEEDLLNDFATFFPLVLKIGIDYQETGKFNVREFNTFKSSINKLRLKLDQDDPQENQIKIELEKLIKQWEDLKNFKSKKEKQKKYDTYVKTFKSVRKKANKSIVEKRRNCIA